ncbi:hypothetical protein RND81_12G049700 [Saponaria officinalis]|uniref:C2 domain-containing protein n=1 Tax=Saponaria officinalis TaxID=3572 RepID=A0AAW1H522_SAPOF
MVASLNLRPLHHLPFSLSLPSFHHRRHSSLKLPLKIRVFCTPDSRRRSIRCSKSELGNGVVVDSIDRPPFDINLAIILAGFAFEAYTTPPDNLERQEIDAVGCKTVYLSESFVREIYDGQLFIKLKKGFCFPAMDPWGTSDPYIVMEFDGQAAKSKIKWGTKEPTWDEEFKFKIKLPPSSLIQVAAWDANLVAPHKRMGNTGLNLEELCDGNLHEVLVELEGMGGGGKVQLEVKYRSFGEIDEDKKWWRIPFVSEFLRKNNLDAAVKLLTGSESVPARQFVQYAFGQLKSLNETYLQKDWLPDIVNHDSKKLEDLDDSSDELKEPSSSSYISEVASENSGSDNRSNAPESSSRNTDDTTQSTNHFWKNFADAISQNVVQKMGISGPDNMKWDGFDIINKIGSQSRKVAEATYIESGLASPKMQDLGSDKSSESSPLNIGKIQSSLPDIKKATGDILRQTDSIFSALMVLSAVVPDLNQEPKYGEHDENDSHSSVKDDRDDLGYLQSGRLGGLDETRAEEMRALFSSAESAMEAWAMLATSLGHPSLIKSEFEKICFLDNSYTDTQVAIWRDPARKRLVVAFRGTEQARWKDLMTDLMLAPAGLNPERIGGDFKQEVQVHSGFLNAYDSVRTRIMSLLKKAIGFVDNDAGPQSKWLVYCTGHSLGGALATLLALELSSTQLAKSESISVTMYNFGSPRVGNRNFADVYNEKVKDSWRVVNHRDIIPTVPRLMGYCHVAQPIYLTAGDQKNTMESSNLSEDGYQGDLIGEATPDVLVSEFMKGEKELVDRILQTEINIFLALRDGSALMQHMEDFYYIALLEANLNSRSLVIKFE